MENIKLDLNQALLYLSRDQIVPESVLPKYDTHFSSDALIEEIERGSEFHYDALTDELYIKKSDGELMTCPDLSHGMAESVDWISDHLPDVFFDTEQGGNPRKSDEADSAYKLICIAHVIKDYRDEIKNIFRNYDYDVMSGLSEYGMISFKDSIQKFQNLNSIRINSIISAAAYKLSEFREKNELFYIGLLSQEEISGLSDLSRNIKLVITKYEQDEGLNPTEMSTMTKISKLQKIERRDLEISKLIEASPVSMIYKILKLTTERIPPVIKSKIFAEAERGAKEYVKDKELSELDAIDQQQQYRKIVIRESSRAVLRTIKMRDLENYKQDPSKFKFKPKS